MRRLKDKIGKLASRASSPDSRTTAKNVLTDVLHMAKDSGDGIPGAALFLGGILRVLEGFNKSAENLETLRKLQDHIYSLKSSISTITGHDYSLDMREDVEILTKAFKDSLNTIDEKRTHSRVRRFSDRNDDEAELRLLAVDIQAALTIFQLSRNVKRERRERLQALSSVLDKLPFVGSASFDSNKNVHKTCFEGTRTEILKRIQEWIDSEDSPPLFWLDGIMGIGKSTIAQTVALRCHESGFLGASFFFSRMEAERSDSARVLPTLAYQLALHDENLKLHIGEALEKEPMAGTKLLVKQMEQLILEPLSNSGKQRKIVIVLDALDECDERGAKELLQLLLGRTNEMSVPVRIFVTSRPEAHIRSVFERLSNHAKIVLHDVERSVIENDISTYVEAKLREIQEEFGLPSSPDWFDEKDRRELVKRAGKLFIYAATAIRFIGDNAMGDPSASMKLLLHTESASDADAAYENLDRLYAEVLFHAVHGSTTIPLKGVLDRYQEVVGTIVLLRDPLSVPALAQITGGTTSSIQAALRNLHSVIAISHGNSDEIPTIYHPSFPEFITNPARCKDPDLHINPAVHERRLAIRCLELLTSRLKRDIVGIRDPTLINSEVEGLSDRVEAAIPTELQYACKHWSSHLTSLTSGDTEILELIESFATKHMLFWFEAMSLLDSTSLAVASIKDTHEWIVRLDCGDLLKTLFNDGYRFILTFFEPIKDAALHVYYSALPFTPHKTTLWSIYQHEVHDTIKVLNGPGSQWSAYLNTLLGHTGPINTVTFSSDGSFLASGSDDNTVRLWDVATGSQIAALKGHTDIIETVTFSSDGLRLASCSRDRTVRLWDTATAIQVATLKGHTSWISTVVFSSDGSRLASGSGDHTVHLWDAASGAQVAVLDDHADSIRTVVFSSDSSRLASGSDDNTVRLWDAATGAQVATLQGHTSWVSTVAFSPDSSFLVSGSDDQTVRLWDAASGADIAVLEGHTSLIRSVAFSPDGLHLASGSHDQVVRLWDLVTSAPKALLKGHTGSVNKVAFSPDGSRLASGSADHTVRLWDAATGAQVAVLEGHVGSINTVVFSPDGSRLVSSSQDHTIFLWDAATAVPVAVREGHNRLVREIAFSPDGSSLASGSDDHTVRLWDTATGAQVAVLGDHSELIRTIAFSTDGFYLTIQTWSRTTLTWSLSPSPTLLDSSSQVDQLPSVHYPFFRYMKDQWLWYSPHPPLLPTRLCYIPAEHQISTHIISSPLSLLALGCRSGQVLLLDISRCPSPPSAYIPS